MTEEQAIDVCNKKVSRGRGKGMIYSGVCSICNELFYSNDLNTEFCSRECGYLSPRNSDKKGQKIKQFCPKNHDTFVVGRAPAGQCAECHRITNKALYEADPEVYSLQGKKFRADHPELREGYEITARCKRVGITVDYYDSLPQKCSFKRCNATEPGGQGGWKLDHDHITGKFRGLLCHNHNVGLGHFHDSIEELQDAIDYLRSHEDTR